MHAQPYSLPALQVILTELWERMGPDGLLRHSVYQELNQGEGPLATHLERKWNELGHAEQTAALRLFLHLVIPLGPHTFARRTASQTELSVDDWRIAGTLATQRILVMRALLTGALTAELVHDALIEQWPTLASHLSAHSDFLEWRDDTRRRLRSWVEADQHPSQLLTGKQLQQGLELLKLVSERERDYLLASHQRQQSARRRRRIAVIAAFTRSLLSLRALLSLPLTSTVQSSARFCSLSPASSSAMRMRFARASRVHPAPKPRSLAPQCKPASPPKPRHHARHHPLCWYAHW